MKALPAKDADKTEEKTASKSDDEAKGASGEQAEIPVPADFAEEVAKEIGPEDYDAALEELAKEIE